MSKDELTNLLMTLNPNFTPDECGELFREIDVNDDGTIQYSEWVDWLSAAEGPHKGEKAGIMLAKDASEMASASTMDSTRRAKLRGKFAQLDKNGNGTLDFQECYEFLHKRYPDMTLPDLKFLYNCADKSNDGALDFYELLDLILTVPAHKAAPAEKGAAKDGLRANVMLRSDDEDKMMAEAWAKCDRDRAEMVSITNDLCNELNSLKDEEERHKAFRTAHAATMRKHYAKTGQLRK